MSKNDWLPCANEPYSYLMLLYSYTFKKRCEASFTFKNAFVYAPG